MKHIKLTRTPISLGNVRNPAEVQRRLDYLGQGQYIDLDSVERFYAEALQEMLYKEIKRRTGVR